MMEPFENQTLAGIVTRYPITARLFERHGLDYCCHGKQRLQDACQRHGLPVDLLCGQLADLVRQRGSDSGLSAGDLPVPELIEHIVSRHHGYVRESVPVLQARLERIVAKHGERFPYLATVRNLFGELADELLSHLAKEERILFPMMQAQYRQFGQCLPARLSGPIHVMESEHERAAELMAEIRQLTNGYQPPEQACQTFRLTLAELQAFEEDLHRHVHLENNVLFVLAE